MDWQIRLSYWFGWSAIWSWWNRDTEQFSGYLWRRVTGDDFSINRFSRHSNEGWAKVIIKYEKIKYYGNSPSLRDTEPPAFDHGRVVWKGRISRCRIDTSSAITELIGDLPQLNLGSWHTGMQPPTPPVKQFISDVDQGLPRSRTSRPFGMAVVIGNQTYTNRDIPTVDLRRTMPAQFIPTWRRFLVARGEFFLTNATKAQFEAHFGTAQDRSGKLSQAVILSRSDVFVYYSGPRAPDLQNQRACFVPADTNPTLVRQTGYELDLFYRNLSEIPARCRSRWWSTPVSVEALTLARCTKVPVHFWSRN